MKSKFNTMKINFVPLLFFYIFIEKSSSSRNYLSPDLLNHDLLRWANDFPNFVSIYSIGDSVQDRPLYVLKLGTNSTAGVPNIKIIGTIHGNEPIGLQLTWKLAKYLIDEFKNSNEHIKNLLGKVNIHLLPLLNPDGYHEAHEGNCEGGQGRTNANKIDLNRNFPSKFHSEQITGIPEPETEAVINWMQTHFLLSAALHSGALVVNYPYDSHPTTGAYDYYDTDTFYSKTDEDEEFKHLARAYAKTHGAMEHGCPLDHSFVDGITNGAEWYAAVGTMQDYNYDFHGCLELTIELNCCKYPDVKVLDEIWNDNKNALLKFIEESQRGVKGIISKDKIPLNGANVSIRGRGIVQKTTEHGEYWRYLLPGTYYIEVEYDNITIVRKFNVPPQTILEPIVLNIDISEVYHEDTIAQRYALDDVATVSNNAYVNLEISTAGSRLASHEDAITERYALDDDTTVSNNTNVNLKMATASSRLTFKYLNATVSLSSKTKISNILIFTFLLFLY